MKYIEPSELRDARINDVFTENANRILLHLQDGRAVAVSAQQSDLNGRPELVLEHVNHIGS